MSKYEFDLSVGIKEVLDADSAKKVEGQIEEQKKKLEEPVEIKVDVDSSAIKKLDKLTKAVRENRKALKNAISSGSNIDEVSSLVNTHKQLEQQIKAVTKQVKGNSKEVGASKRALTDAKKLIDQLSVSVDKVGDGGNVKVAVEQTQQLADAGKAQAKISDAVIAGANQTTAALKRQAKAARELNIEQREQLNMAGAIKRYNRLMHSIGKDHLTIGKPVSEGTSNWNISDMVGEAQRQLDDAYAEENRPTDKRRQKGWENRRAELTGFIEEYRKFVNDVVSAQKSMSQYDSVAVINQEAKATDVKAKATKNLADATRELAKANKEASNIVYHAGDLSNITKTQKSFPLGNVPPRKGSGIGGLTGLYTTEDVDGFWGNEWSGAPISTIDISDYKLLDAKSNEVAEKVGSFLNDLNSTIYGYSESIDEKDWEFVRSDNVKSVEELYAAHQELFKDSSMSFEVFADFIKEASGKIAGKAFKDIESVAIDEGIAKSGISQALQGVSEEIFQSDSFKTQFLKMLGYEGVDLRGTKYGGTYTGGTVLFDLKQESIVETNAMWSDVMRNHGYPIDEADLEIEKQRRQLAFDTAKAYSKQADEVKNVALSEELSNDAAKARLTAIQRQAYNYRRGASGADVISARETKLSGSLSEIESIRTKFPALEKACVSAENAITETLSVLHKTTPVIDSATQAQEGLAQATAKAEQQTEEHTDALREQSFVGQNVDEWDGVYEKRQEQRDLTSDERTATFKGKEIKDVLNQLHLSPKPNDNVDTALNTAASYINMVLDGQAVGDELEHAVSLLANAIQEKGRIDRGYIDEDLENIWKWLSDTRLSYSDKDRAEFGSDWTKFYNKNRKYLRYSGKRGGTSETLYQQLADEFKGHKYLPSEDEIGGDHLSLIAGLLDKVTTAKANNFKVLDKANRQEANEFANMIIGKMLSNAAEMRGSSPAFASEELLENEQRIGVAIENANEGRERAVDLENKAADAAKNQADAQLVDNYGRALDADNNKLMQGTKLLNEQQKVIRLFHNSNNIFDKFEGKEMSGNNTLGRGHYLSFDQKLYMEYGKYQTQWYANVQKMFDANSMDAMPVEDATKIIASYCTDAAESFVNRMFSELTEGTAFDAFSAIGQIAEAYNADISDVFKAAGYDAVKINEEINVFDPNKIYRANENVLTCDTEAFKSASKLSDEILLTRMQINELEGRISKSSGQEKTNLSESLRLEKERLNSLEERLAVHQKVIDEETYKYLGIDPPKQSIVSEPSVQSQEAVSTSEELLENERQIGAAVADANEERKEAVQLEEQLTEVNKDNTGDSQKKKKSKKDADDKPVSIYETDVEDALKQLRDAFDNQTSLIDLSKVNTTSDVESQIQKMASNILGDNTKLSLGSVVTEGDMARITLYNKELGVTVSQMYKLQKASDDASVANLVHMPDADMYRHDVKAANAYSAAQMKKTESDNRWLIQQLQKLDRQETTYKYSNKKIDGSHQLINEEAQYAGKTIDNLAQSIKERIKGAMDGALTDSVRNEILDNLRVLDNEIKVQQHKKYASTRMNPQEFEEAKKTFEYQIDNFEAKAKNKNVFSQLSEDITTMRSKLKDLNDENVSSFVDSLRTANAKLNAEATKEQGVKQQQQYYQSILNIQERLYEAKKKLASLEVDGDESSAAGQKASRKVKELQEQYDASLKLLKNDKDSNAVLERAVALEKELATFKSEKQTETASKSISALRKTSERISGVDGVDDIQQKLTQKIQELEDAKSKFIQSQSVSDQTDLKNKIVDAENYAKSINKMADAWEKTQSAIDSGDLQYLGNIDQSVDIQEQMSNKISAAFNNATISNMKFDDATNTLSYTVAYADGKVEDMVATLHEYNGAVTAGVQKTGKINNAWQDIGDALKGVGKQLFSYIGNMLDTASIIGAMKQGFNTVLEIDTALTELRKVTNETDATYKNFLQTMSKTGAVVGSTVKDLTTSASDWARLNI